MESKVLIGMSAELLHRLDEASDSVEITRSAYIRQALCRAVKEDGFPVTAPYPFEAKENADANC